MFVIVPHRLYHHCHQVSLDTICHWTETTCWYLHSADSNYYCHNYHHYHSSWIGLLVGFLHDHIKFLLFPQYYSLPVCHDASFGVILVYVSGISFVWEDPLLVWCPYWRILLGCSFAYCIFLHTNSLLLRSQPMHHHCYYLLLVYTCWYWS